MDVFFYVHYRVFALFLFFFSNAVFTTVFANAVFTIGSNAVYTSFHIITYAVFVRSYAPPARPGLPERTFDSRGG